tara:strand:+ start:5317 stop:5463 length:147 start_codon:yes stop_codon:yes gene_type:complete
MSRANKSVNVVDLLDGVKHERKKEKLNIFILTAASLSFLVFFILLLSY